MGALPTAFLKEGGVRVLVDKPCYQPGDDVTGRVVLNLIKELPKKPNDGIQLKFLGQEFVQWHTGGGNSNSTMKVYHRTIEIVRSESELGDFKGMDNYPCGQFEFPFVFKLPTYLPSSYKHEMRNYKGSAEITYKVSVLVTRRGMMKSNLSADGIVEVRAPVMLKPEIPIQEEQGRQVMTCCCLPRGRVMMTVSTPTNRCWKGGEFVGSIRMVNASSVSIPAVQVLLVKYVWYSDGRNHVENPLQLENLMVQGVYANSEREEEFRFKVAGPPAMPPLVPAFKCTIVAVSYFLRVYMPIPMAPGLHIKIPIEIYEADPRTMLVKGPPGGGQNEGRSGPPPNPMEMKHPSRTNYIGVKASAPEYILPPLPPAAQYDANAPPAYAELPEALPGWAPRKFRLTSMVGEPEL